MQVEDFDSLKILYFGCVNQINRYMKFTTTLKRLCLTGAAIFLIGAAYAQNPHEEIASDLNKAGGVFYMYSFNTPAATPPPNGYKPFYISHYGRHGARYVAEERTSTYVARVMEKAHAEGKLTPQGEETYKKFMVVFPTLRDQAGELTRKGQLQHKQLAKRMYDNFPEIFKNKARIEANSTVVPRCVASMNSFCESLKEQNPTLNITKEANKADMYYLNPQSSSNPAGTKTDLEHKTSKAPWRAEHRKYCQSILNVNLFLARIFTDPDYARRICDPITFETEMFTIASDMQCTDFTQTFTDLFTPQEQFVLWECENYKYYIEKGPDPRTKGRMPALSETLLNNIVTSAQEDMANGKPNVRLRFGHDGCIMALLTLMQIDGWSTPVSDPSKIKDVWQSYNIPMASNVQWIFYKNPKNSDILVRMMLNEKEVKLPLPGDLAPYYRWQDFKNYYTQVVNQARITLENTK